VKEAEEAKRDVMDELTLTLTLTLIGGSQARRDG